MSNIEQEIIGNLKQTGFTKPENSASKDKPPSEGEKNLAHKWQDRIDLAKMSMNGGSFEESVAKDRKYVRGEQEEDGEGGLVRANLIHAHIRKSVNQVYARNPKFAIRPSETVSQVGIKKMRLFGKTAEIVLNRHFEDGDLKRRAKACLRSAKTTGIGWVKVYYQTQLEPNPIIRNKIIDSRQQQEQLEHLESMATDPDERANKARAKLELKQFISQLEKEEMMIVSEGLVIDVVDPVNMVIDLSTIQNFDDWKQTPFLAERVVMTLEEAKKRWGPMPSGTKEFKIKASDGTLGENISGDHATLVHIWEIHDRQNQLIHYMADGGDKFLQKPLEPKFVSEQWYPYIPMAINIVDGQFLPQSDVFLLRELQDEHNAARTRFAEHRDISVPFKIAKRSDVTDKDAQAITDGMIGELVRIDGIPGQPIRNSIDVLSPPPIDPSVYTTDHTERDFERVVGGGETSQPRNNKSRTLGEAQILSQDTQTQSGADTDEIEDWFEQIAKHTIELLLQALTPEQVEELAGPRAEPEVDEQGQPTGELKDGSVWPKMDKAQIFNLLSISIQAGSSGKPNRDRETQVWTQFLLPKLTEAIQAISQLRQAGQDELANSLVVIAQETMRRLDERFDVHEFLPAKKDKNNEQPDPKELEALQKQQEVQQLEMERMKAEIEETRSKAAKNMAQAQKSMRDAEGDQMEEQFKNYKAQTDVALKSQQIKVTQEGIQAQREAAEMNRQSQAESNENQRDANHFNRISQKESNLNKEKRE